MTDNKYLADIYEYCEIKNNNYIINFLFNTDNDCTNIFKKLFYELFNSIICLYCKKNFDDKIKDWTQCNHIHYSDISDIKNSFKCECKTPNVKINEDDFIKNVIPFIYGYGVYSSPIVSFTDKQLTPVDLKFAFKNACYYGYLSVAKIIYNNTKKVNKGHDIHYIHSMLLDVSEVFKIVCRINNFQIAEWIISICKDFNTSYLFNIRLVKFCLTPFTTEYENNYVLKIIKWIYNKDSGTCLNDYHTLFDNKRQYNAEHNQSMINKLFNNYVYNYMFENAEWLYKNIDDISLGHSIYYSVIYGDFYKKIYFLHKLDKYCYYKIDRHIFYDMFCYIAQTEKYDIFEYFYNLCLNEIDITRITLLNSYQPTLDEPTLDEAQNMHTDLTELNKYIIGNENEYFFNNEICLHVETIFDIACTKGTLQMAQLIYNLTKQACKLIHVTGIFSTVCKLGKMDMVLWLQSLYPENLLITESKIVIRKKKNIDRKTWLIKYKIIVFGQIYNSMIISELPKPLEKCSICLDNDSNIYTKCKHMFCKTCLFEWCKDNSSCPYCRYDLCFEELTFLKKNIEVPDLIMDDNIMYNDSSDLDSDFDLDEYENFQKHPYRHYLDESEDE